MMDFSETAKKIITQARDWTFEGDCALLDWMQDIAKNLDMHGNTTKNNLESLNIKLKRAQTSLDNASNSLTSLQYSQFIESRVFEDDETTLGSSSAVAIKEDTEKPKNESQIITDEIIEQFLKNNLKLLHNCHEKYAINYDDSDDEESANDFVYQPRNPYNERPLPHIYGSKLWKENWHVGLCDGENDYSADEISEEFSESSTELSDEHETTSYSRSTPSEWNNTPELPAKNTNVLSNTSILNAVQQHARDILNAEQTARTVGSETISNTSHSLFSEHQNEPDLFTIPSTTTTVKTFENNKIPTESKAKPAPKNIANTLDVDLFTEKNVSNIAPSIHTDASITSAVRRRPVNLFDDEDFQSFMTEISDKANTNKMQKADVNENRTSIENRVDDSDSLKYKKSLPIAAKRKIVNLFESPNSSPERNQNEQYLASNTQTIENISHDLKSSLKMNKKTLFDDVDDDDDFLNVFKPQQVIESNLEVKRNFLFDDNDDSELANDNTKQLKTSTSVGLFDEDKKDKKENGNIEAQRPNPASIHLFDDGYDIFGDKVKNPSPKFKVPNTLFGSSDEDDDLFGTKSLKPSNIFKNEMNETNTEKVSISKVNKWKKDDLLDKNNRHSDTSEAKIPTIINNSSAKIPEDKNIEKSAKTGEVEIKRKGIDLFDDNDLLSSNSVKAKVKQEEKKSVENSKKLLKNNNQKTKMSEHIPKTILCDDTNVEVESKDNPFFAKTVEKEQEISKSTEQPKSVEIKVDIFSNENSKLKHFPSKLFDDSDEDDDDDLFGKKNKIKQHKQPNSAIERELSQSNDATDIHVTPLNTSTTEQKFKEKIITKTNHLFEDENDENEDDLFGKTINDSGNTATITNGRNITIGNETKQLIEKVESEKSINEDLEELIEKEIIKNLPATANIIQTKENENNIISTAKEDISTSNYNYNSLFLDEQPPDDDGLFNFVSNKKTEHTEQNVIDLEQDNEEPPLPAMPEFRQSVEPRNSNDYSNVSFFSDVPPPDIDNSTNVTDADNVSLNSNAKNLHLVFYDDFDDNSKTTRKADNMKISKHMLFDNELPPDDDFDIVANFAKPKKIRKTSDVETATQDIPDKVTKIIEHLEKPLVPKETSEKIPTVATGKLQMPKLNINVQALLPGAGIKHNFKKTIPQESSAISTNSTVIVKQVDNNVLENTSDTSENLLINACKYRVKAPLGRRPSTRHARQKSYNQALLDEKHDQQEQMFEQKPQQTTTKQFSNANLTATKNETAVAAKEYMFKKQEEEAKQVPIECSSINSVVEKKTADEINIEKQTFNKIKPESIEKDKLNIDEKIIKHNISTTNTAIRKGDSQKIFEETQKVTIKAQSISKINMSEATPTGINLFTSSDDGTGDDLFANTRTLKNVSKKKPANTVTNEKNSVKQKTNKTKATTNKNDSIFDSESDDTDFFKDLNNKSSTKKTKIKNKDVKMETSHSKSLFSDVESDEDGADLFGNRKYNTKSTPKTGQPESKSVLSDNAKLLSKINQLSAKKLEAFMAEKNIHKSQTKSTTTATPLEDNPLADLLNSS